MKRKTHSGAKKRFRVKSSGLVKRKKAGRRHLLEHKSSGRKRQLGGIHHVNDANMIQMKRLLPV